MDPLCPQLLRFSGVALLGLRLIVAAVFFESGRRHAGDPIGRAASIGLSPTVTRILGVAEMAGALKAGISLLGSSRSSSSPKCARASSRFGRDS